MSFSSRPREVLREADRLASATGAQIVLLHVVENELDTLGLGPSMDGGTEARVQHGHSALIELASRELGRRTEFATAVLAHPDRAEAIRHYARAIGADLVVLEARDAQVEGTATFSQKLLGQIDCPLLLVRTGSPAQRMAA